MPTYNVKENEYPAQSRSERRRKTGQGSSGASGSVTIVSGSGGVPVIPAHDQLSGITSTADQYPETAKGIHLTASDADKLKTLLTAILNVISSTDTETVAGDTNVFTALRTLNEIAEKALSKINDDTLRGLITVIKGLASKDFNDGVIGDGFSLQPRKDTEGNALSTWEFIVDYLKVRKKATFVEIEIDKITHVGGIILLTPASIKCTKVEPISGGYRCYFDNSEKENTFVAGDQAICQVFSLPTTKRYWRYVMSVGLDYIDLSEDDCELGSDIPSEGDDIVQLGNRTNAQRRGAIILSSYGDLPYIAEYTDIGVLYEGETSPFTLENREGTSIKPGESEFTGKITVRGGNGQKYRVPADRGDWAPGAYYYYDRVRYGNAQWLCVAIPSTTLEPSDSNSYVWKKELSSGNGTPGNWVSQVFKESYDQPETPTGTDPIPSGWIDGPTGPGTWWMSKSVINGVTGLAGDWSYPVQASGANGTKTPFRFAIGTLNEYPAIDVANINPGESWLENPPTVGVNEFLWMTKAEVRQMAKDVTGNVFDDIFSDEFWGNATLERVDQLVANWSTPVRITGEKGIDGRDGKDYEYIYKRTITNDAPAIPETSQDDDFVPLGWTDDMTGADSNYRFEWVSKRIKINGVWGNFSSPSVIANWSEDAIEASLSNSQHNIPTDNNGNNGNFTGASCTMYIYKGVVDDSANWEVSIVKSAGVTGSLSGKTYSVTGLSTDNGYVDFTASRAGYASITKRMTLTKSKTGEPGVTPTAYWLVTPPSVARSSAGVYTPASFTVYSYKSVSATPEVHAGQFIISETEDGSTYTVKYTSAANESGKSYTPSSANVKSFRILLRKSVTDSTVLDEQIIPVVMQGANGTDGISYMLSANANVVTKTVALSTVTYTPSTLTFNPRKRVGSAVPVAPADCSLKIQGWNGTGWVDISNIASATELTYSVPVSATYTQYRAQLYLSAVMVQELVVNVVEDAKSGKDALAFAFGGFSSYEEYVLSAISKESLFAGGFIRTVLIEVEALFAKALQISTIADLVGTQFDANLVTVTQQKGMTFPALINGTDTNLNITPQSLPELATFLSASSLTGTNYLTAFTNEVWSSSGGPQYGEKTKISPSYQTIPAGVNSLKWNSIAMTATFTVPSGGSGDPDRKGGLWISLYAHFYNGSTYLGRQFMGTVGGMGTTRTYNLSGSISAGQCSVPTNANRVYLYAQFACDVRYTTQTAPDCNLNFTALPSLAYFASSTGVYKTQVAPDGVAVARDASNYIHIKAGNNKMLLSFMGDIDSNSIAQKLLTMYIAANGLIGNSGGYMRIAGLATGLYVTKVNTGIWKITHNIYSNWGIRNNSYSIHLTGANAGYNIPAYMYVSAMDTTNYNWIEVRAINSAGSLVDTEFYLTIMRI